MPLTAETTAKLLMEAIKEDRTEIRQIKDRIYANASNVTVASFVITPFLLDRTPELSKWVWLVVVDGALVFLLWVLFAKLIRDVNLGQRFLEARERKLHALQGGETPTERLLVFGPLEGSTRQGIRHRGMHLIVAAATTAILAKLLVVAVMAGGFPMPRLPW